MRQDERKSDANTLAPPVPQECLQRLAVEDRELYPVFRRDTMLTKSINLILVISYKNRWSGSRIAHIERLNSSSYTISMSIPEHFSLH
jgi:hypothetical protein